MLNVSRNWLKSAHIGNSEECNAAAQLIISDISHNRIRSIDVDDFKQSVVMRQLHLSHNLIAHIHRDAFKACPLLQQLQLENNSIEELPTMPGICSLPPFLHFILDFPSNLESFSFPSTFSWSEKLNRIINSFQARLFI